MKNVKLGVVLLGLLAAAVAGPAAAQAKDDSGILIGGSLGMVQYRHGCNNLVVPCNDRDPGYRIFTGYQFNKTWSAEFGWADLGPLKGDGTINGQFASFIVKNRAYDVVGVGAIPVTENLNVFGKFGFFHTRTTVETNIGGVTGQAGSSNHNWSYGAGVQYNWGRLGIRVEWQRWDNAGTAQTIEDDIDFLSAGLVFRF